MKRVTDDDIRSDIKKLRERLKKAADNLMELHPPRTREARKKTELLNREIEHIKKLLAMARSALKHI